MKRRGFFVTGTDTGIGKTWCSAALLAALRRRGHTALGMKPVASGCAVTAEGPRSDDALLLMQQGTTPAPPYELMNPYALTAPIAPHLAARHAGVEIRLERILATLAELSRRADFTVIEGIGGWHVPLNARETVADLAGATGLPVILVVGIRLGCLNHALLSAAAIRHGPGLAGWIANHVDADTAYANENIDSLRERIDAPLLGVL
ncbi:MAG: dethiobiotin synthase, partial [Gammaproteobacteria bacterium]|nr:dethiobiotin synthase [Gammaproteobacteria bacterium]